MTGLAGWVTGVCDGARGGGETHVASWQGGEMQLTLVSSSLRVERS